MQKIVIKNFGPVKDAEIEIKKVLILIGEQASGKSTIAKLIYFFKSLSNYWFGYFSKINTKFDSISSSDIINFTQNKFSVFFNIKQDKPFEIIYYYNSEENIYLKFNFNKELGLETIFSSNFIDNILLERIINVRKSIGQYQEDSVDKQGFELILSHSKYENALLSLYLHLNTIFNDKQNQKLFMIAGRSVSVNYSDLFEKELFASLQNKEEPSIDESLMLEFMKRVSIIKDTFRKIGSFEGGIKYYKNSDEKKEFLEKITSFIYTILKGYYVIDDFGEAIILKDKTKIYLNDSSSGQQESIRILQEAFMVCFYQGAKALRIIEEPEAHLFPIAQKQLIELLALMVNYQPENQLIITTHSPYILTVFNHLLFASRVIAKNPAAEAEVREIVDKDCWLEPNEFSAYSLGNESFPEDNAKYCETIFDPEMGTLEQNYLDTVSEMLGWEFNSLYRIHGRTFKRK